MVIGLLEEAQQRERKLRQLQHWVEQLLRARYGPRRERMNENQLFLFAVALVSAGREAPPEPEASAAQEKAQRGAGKHKGHGRQRLPKTLERRRVVYDLEEAKRQCPECQEELKRIGEDSQRAAGIRAGVARGDRRSVSEIRLPEGMHGRDGGKAHGADRKRIAGAGAVGARGGQQVWGSLAAEPPGGDLPAPGCGVAAPDDVRLDARLRRSGESRSTS